MRLTRAILLCLLLCIALSHLVIAQTTVGNYTKEIIVTIPWGDAPGEIGHHPDYKSYGPESFTVTPNDEICLLDTFNHRVLIFDQAGELTQYFTIQDFEPYSTLKVVYVDDEDALYINRLRDNSYLVYSLDGTHQKTIKCDTQIESLFYVKEGIIAWPVGKIIDTSKVNVETIQKGAGVEPVYLMKFQQDRALSDSIMDSIKFKHSDFRYTRDLGRSENNFGRFIVNSQYIDSKTIDFSSLYPNYHFIPEGDTPNKEVIIVGLPDPPSHLGKSTVLIKLNKDMEIVSIIEDSDLIPTSGMSPVRYPIIIADNGDIYTLNVNADGAKIYKWSFE